MLKYIDCQIFINYYDCLTTNYFIKNEVNNTFFLPLKNIKQ